MKSLSTICFLSRTQDFCDHITSVISLDVVLWLQSYVEIVFCQIMPVSLINFASSFPCSGYTLLRDPHHNKGLAFNDKERDAHYLRGLLPPVVVSQELQVST